MRDIIEQIIDNAERQMEEFRGVRMTDEQCKAFERFCREDCKDKLDEIRKKDAEIMDIQRELINEFHKSGKMDSSDGK